jgi:hypothetical protein
MRKRSGPKKPLKKDPTAKPGRDRAVQTKAIARVQPWLDYANNEAVPWDEPLAESPSPADARSLAERTVLKLPGLYELWPQLIPASRARPADCYPAKGHLLLDRRFSRLFWSVRKALEWYVVAGMRPIAKRRIRGRPRIDRVDPQLVDSMSSELGIGVAALPALRADGRMGSTIGDPFWRAFLRDLDGVEAARLKHCPIPTCGAIFYCARANSLSCPGHRALNNTRRRRASLRQYKANHQFREKTGLKGVRGRPRRELESLRQALEEIHE